MIRTLLLPPALREQILAAARAAAPRECCGLVEGVRDDRIARAFALHPARNLADRDGRFEIDPQDQFDALRLARAAGRVLVGCYHSHPGGVAEPSPADLAGAGEDNFLWLIAAEDTLAGFVYCEGGFSGLKIGADCVTSSG